MIEKEIINEWLNTYLHLILKYNIHILGEVKYINYNIHLDKNGFWMLIDDNKITLELMNETTIKLICQMLPYYQKEMDRVLCRKEL